MNKITVYILINILFVGAIFGQEEACGDGITYANEKQTKNDRRFASYSKIEGIPTFNDGLDAFNKLVETNLKVNKEGKDMVFRLNYMFIVGCDGKIMGFITLGNAIFSDLTNIEEIIISTNGKWTPAIKDGKAVDCIYFSKKTIVGSNYQQ